MRKLLLSLSAGLVAFGALAINPDDLCTIDGVTYRFQTTHMQVTDPEGDMSKTYSGILTIPATVNYEGTRYEVAFSNVFCLIEGAPELTALRLTGSFNQDVYQTINNSEKLAEIVLPAAAPDYSALEVNTCGAVAVSTELRDGKQSYVIKTPGVKLSDGTPAQTYVFRYNDDGTTTKQVANAAGELVVPASEAEQWGISTTQSPDNLFVRVFITDNINLHILAPMYGSGQAAVGNFEYAFSADAAMITGFSASATGDICENLVIPDAVTYGGKTYAVERIATGAFFNKQSVKTVDFGKVSAISNNAFAGTSLEKVEIPATITSIGYGAFANCRALSRVDFAIGCDARLSTPFSQGNVFYIKDLSFDNDEMSFTVVCNIYKGGKKLPLTLECYPDKFTVGEDGRVTIPKDKVSNDTYRISYSLVSPELNGSIASTYLEWMSTDGIAPYVYLIGAPIGWNTPGAPESGYNSTNAWENPTEANADLFNPYRMTQVEPGYEVYAGQYYLPASSLCGGEATFRFTTALTGWDSPEMIGSGAGNFSTESFSLDSSVGLQGLRAVAGDQGNWGVTVAETTPVTIALVKGVYNSYTMYITKGKCEVAVIPGTNSVAFISEAAGVEEIAVPEADDANAPVEYYDLRGARVRNPSHGFYIRRQGSKVEKIIIR